MADRRKLVAAVLAFVAAAVLLPATPASAHAAFVGVTTVPVSTTREVVMNVPHELEDGIYNVEVAVQVPTNWDATACATKPTWTCTIEVEDGHEVVTWRKSGGPAEDETFRLTVRAPATTGPSPFPTDQVYSNGHSELWAGADAPQLQAVPPNASTTTAPTPTTHPSPPTTTNNTDNGDNDDDDDDNDNSSPTTRPSTPTVPGATTTTAPGATTTTDPDATTTTTDPDATTTTTDGDDDERDDERDREASGRSTEDDDQGGAGEQAGEPGTPDDGGGGSSTGLVLGLLALLALGGGAGYVMWQRSRAPAGPDTD